MWGSVALAWIVRIVHLCVVAFVALAPMSRNPRVVAAHVALVPVLWVHWLVRDDSCVLTEIEKRLRGVSSDDSFIQSIVGPVYLPDESVRLAAWYGSVAAWVVAVSRATRGDVAAALVA